MSIKQTVADRLNSIREFRGFTFNRLSELTGIQVKVLVMYEEGERAPSLEKLCKLADALGTTTDNLLGREG